MTRRRSCRSSPWARRSSARAGVRVEHHADAGGRGRCAAAAAGADRAGRPRRLLLDQGPGLPLRRGAHDQGAQTTPVVGMTLESDTGEGTAFVSPRNDVRFVDSGEYMFHRNLFKVDDKPPNADPRHSTISGVIDGQTIGKVSKWLDDVTPLTADPNYKRTSSTTTSIRSSSTRASSRSPRQNPEIAEIVAMPNKTNGYQRKAQATSAPRRARPRSPRWSSAPPPGGMRAATASPSRWSTGRARTCRSRSRSTAGT